MTECADVDPRTELDFTVRAARAADAGELVRLRRLMFESMHVDTTANDWARRCQAWFAKHIGDPWFIALVVEAPDRSGSLASSAVAEIMDRIPRPANPSGRSAYISSVSTDPPWQRRGMGGALTAALLEEMRRLGVTCFELHATPAGRGLYESIGFAPRAGAREMRIIDP